MLQVEQSKRAMLELGAHNATRWQAESVAVKGERSVQIRYAERDHRNPWLHGLCVRLLFFSLSPIGIATRVSTGGWGAASSFKTVLKAFHIPIPSQTSAKPRQVHRMRPGP